MRSADGICVFHLPISIELHSVPTSQRLPTLQWIDQSIHVDTRCQIRALDVKRRECRFQSTTIPPYAISSESEIGGDLRLKTRCAPCSIARRASQWVDDHRRLRPQC